MKVLMIGLGSIGQRHVRNLSALMGDQLELIAYRTRRSSTVLTDRMQVELGADVESKYRVRTFTDLDAALSEAPQIAFICNPTSLHIPVALKAANAGCHLFIEKPLSHHTEGIQQLISVVRQKGLVGYVGYQMRFHPCLRRVHALLAQGVIGQVLSVQAEVGEYLPGWHPYEDYRQMYASRRDLGGGAILSQIHELDYLYWFFGLPRRIFALGGHLSSLEVDVEDIANILMSFKVGAMDIPVFLHQDYVQRPPSRNCLILGNNGKIEVDFVGLTVRWYDGEGKLAEEAHPENFQRNQLFLDELSHFLACVRGEEEPLTSLEDGFQSLRMALAARESLETGKVVNLSPFLPLPAASATRRGVREGGGGLGRGIFTHE
jgi:predicted dehydrogenase